MKRPRTELKPECYYNNYDKLHNAGFIIGNDIIVLDFDNDNKQENQIINYIDQKYPTLTVKTNRGKHFYYKMPSKHKFHKIVDGLSCLGFQCDYLTGERAYSTIKLKGQLREMNRKFSLDSMSILPEELYPLKKAKKLSGMDEGDGRNNSLYAHLLAVRESFPEIDINTLANDINENIFAKKLDKSELKEVIKSAKKKEIKEVKKKEIIYSSFDELQRRELPPVKFFVDGLIPQGLTIIASLPKIGKSWMMLDLGINIARGTSFLGFKTRKTGVMYLALEDSENRLKDRANKLLNNQKAPKNFRYAIRCDNLGNGLISELEEIIKKEPDIEVIIVDTLQKIRRPYKGTSLYTNDYGEMTEVKDFADKYGICLIFVHHLKKGNEDDVFGKVSGTNAIMGASDTTIILDKKDRADENTIMHAIGRDIDYQKYVLRFNKDKYKWKLISTYEEMEDELEKQDYDNNPLIKTILIKVRENNGIWKTTCKDFSEELFNNYSDMIDTTINQKRLKEIKKQLLKYDGITFFMYGPNKGKRDLVFKKNVGFVDNVDSSTNSTIPTKKEMYKNV